MKRWRRVQLVSLVLAAVACADGTAPQRTLWLFMPPLITLVPGASISPSVSLSTPTLIDVTQQASWTTRDSTIAVVSGGRVTAKGVGTTYLVASVAGDTNSVAVRVRLVTFQVIVPGKLFYTCGLTTDSAAFCWGRSDLGGLGTGTVDTISYFPVAATGGNAFVELGVGDDMACGLTAEGQAFCWGTNFNGALGIGSTAPYVREPTAVAGGHSFTTLGVGSAIACGLDHNGQTWCWGGDNVVRSTPVAVGGSLALRTLAVGGFHRCGLTTDSVAYCWGSGLNGQIGDDTTLFRDSPTPVAGNLKFAGLAAGPFTTCGWTASGAAYCWGMNDHGELGDSSFATRDVPVAVRGGLAWRHLAPGLFNTCGVTTGNAAYCWGSNESGEAGTGEPTPMYLTPRAVAGGLMFAQLRTNGFHTCGVTVPPARAYCWGLSEYGALGDSAAAHHQRTPWPVGGQP
jgi:alpha-tubulin suppressor-like RCC1 family protein